MEKIVSKYRKGSTRDIVATNLKVDAWEILKRVQKENELYSLSTAVKFLAKRAGYEVT